MKFFLDENLAQSLTQHLGAIFRLHDFVGVKDLGSKGMEDVPLYSTVAEAGCDVFVTADLSQLAKAHERAACRDQRLHWIGVHQVHASGYHVIAGPASTLIHALPFVLDHLAKALEPQYFKLNKSERNYTKVFEHCGPL